MTKLEKEDQMNYSGVLQTEDLQSQAETFLTRKAKAALNNKSHHQIVRVAETNEVFKCAYFGVRVPQDEVDDGVKLLAGKMNDLASKDLIHSSLSHFLKLNLIDVRTTPECAVLCYVLVPEATYNELMKDPKSNSIVEDGNVP